MNQLSWLLYLAELSASLSGFCVAVAIMAIILMAIRWLIFSFNREDDNWKKRRGEDITLTKPPAKFSYTIIGIVFVLCFVSALLPSKNTVYAIAASQLGQQVITSPIGVKAEKALEGWLDKQISDTTSKTDEKTSQ